MRKTVSMASYLKVKDFLKKQKTPISMTKLRDECKVDYDSVKLIVATLISGKEINKSIIEVQNGK